MCLPSARQQSWNKRAESPLWLAAIPQVSGPKTPSTFGCLEITVRQVEGLQKVWIFSWERCDDDAAATRSSVCPEVCRTVVSVLRGASRFVHPPNDGDLQLSSFGRRHHTIAMTTRQPAIAATNTAANARLLSCIFNPHDKAGILPPRCKVRHRSFRASCPRTRSGARPNEAPEVGPDLGPAKPDPGAGVNGVCGTRRTKISRSPPRKRGFRAV